MNLTAPDQISAGQFFSAQQVQEVRVVATQTGRRVVDVLEEQAGLNVKNFVDALGCTLRYPVFSMDDLNILLPAFDTLPFAEALERECIALRSSDGGLLMIMSDPSMPDSSYGRNNVFLQILAGVWPIERTLRLIWRTTRNRCMPWTPFRPLRERSQRSMKMWMNYRSGPSARMSAPSSNWFTRRCMTH